MDHAPRQRVLRIVSDALWDAAHARFTRTRTTLATAQGPRPIVRRDIDSRYLLSGHARCGVCGWAMTIVTRPSGTAPHRRRVPFLTCLSNHKRGQAVCPNGRLVRLETADQAVLEALGSEALDSRLISTIIDLVFAQLAPSSPRRRSGRSTASCARWTGRSRT